MTVSCVDNIIKMDDIAFNDWPTIDINTGTNSWFPAYGFQPPAGIIEREDFLGNPDADYFLNGTSTPCLYLETIHEETSDDLRSDSEISTESPLGWLATDSETDSVICMDAHNETDCESDREIACPAKRRRQDNFLTLPTVDIEDYQSISRTSSLIQFETLEQQCQETSNSTPSIYSQFSFDSLEAARKHHQDSNNNHNNNNANSDSDLCDNETIFSNLKAWHSFDNLLPKRKDKFSAENLSEDSGYGEQQMNAYNKFLKTSPKQKSNFCAYDCEIFQQQISGNFSASRQNLSIFTEDDDDDFPSRLLVANHHTSSKQKLILERPSSTECVSKYTTTSSSTSASSSAVSVPDLSLYNGNNKECTVVYSSVPKDLHLLGDRILSDDWGQVITTRIIEKQSIATTNCDLADFADVMENYRREGSYSEAMRNRVDLSDDEHSLCYNNNNNNNNNSNNNNNKRRASYKPKTTLEVFDRKILQVISESIQSMNSSQILDRPTVHNNSNRIKTAMRTNHNAVSTPNLALKYHDSEQDDEIMDILMDEERRRRSEQDVRRKSYSTNSGVSDFDERNTNIKGVHFSPVVSEVNWQDDNNSTTTAERESSYSLSTTPESELIENFTRALLDDTHASSSNSHNESPPKRSPKRQQADLSPLSNTSRLRSRSQPDMSKNNNNNNNNKLNRRRGSLLVKKEKDGTVVKAYVDSDGIQYKHTHLDDDVHGRLLGTSTKYHSADLSPPATTTKSSKLSHVFSSTSAITTSGGNVGSSTTDRGRHGIITTTITKSQPVGVGMDADVVVNVRKHEEDETKKHNNKTAKLGGFFSRLASFRFTNKKGGGGGGDKKGKKKGQTDSRPRADALLGEQRIATKEDYIYIPLKGPSISSSDSQNNHRSQSNNEQNGQIVRQQQQQQQPNTAGARKPPLPRAPPRVVGASVKRNDSSSSNSNAQHHHHRHNHHQPQIEKQQQQHHQHQQQQQQQQHRRRRTIDSAESCPRPMEPMGLIETDLDTEVTVITSGANVKTRSLMNLGAEPRLGLLDTACNRQRRLNTNEGDNSSVTCHTATGRPHKSMEFLLDKQNLKVAEPPENELQKGERVMSEHQLRVQRSLQKLNVPDWYKQSQIPREGFLLKKSNRETRWTGTSSGGGGNGSNKTTSLSSLGSNLQSPIILSPNNNNNNNNNQTQPFVRWSTSKLNSTASSPCASLRSSFNARQPNGSISPSSSLRSSFSYRQPYLGWRSQERLTRPRTPAERLANSLLNQQQQQQQKQQEDSPEIQTSIKEVTSAIVHYVSGLKPPDSDDNRSESASPRGSQKLCWLESSFVGIRPLDSPETPVGLSENETTTPPQPPSSLRLDLEQTHNGESIHA